MIQTTTILAIYSIFTIFQLYFLFISAYALSSYRYSIVNNKWRLFPSILPMTTSSSSTSDSQSNQTSRPSQSIQSKTTPVDRSGEKKLRSKEWAEERGLVPGYGGLWPGDPNAPKVKVTFRSKATGKEYKLDVPTDRYIYYVFEEEGVELPIINQSRMCRQGCCTICASKLVEGKVKMDAPLGLLKEMRKEGYILTCCSYPKSDLVLELQTEDEVYVKQWAEGFEGGGVEWGGFLPDED